MDLGQMKQEVSELKAMHNALAVLRMKGLEVGMPEWAVKENAEVMEEMIVEKVKGFRVAFGKMQEGDEGFEEMREEWWGWADYLD